MDSTRVKFGLVKTILECLFFKYFQLSIPHVSVDKQMQLYIISLLPKITELMSDYEKILISQNTSVDVLNTFIDKIYSLMDTEIKILSEGDCKDTFVGKGLQSDFSCIKDQFNFLKVATIPPPQ